MNTITTHHRSISIFNNLKMICNETIQDKPIIEDWLACSIAEKINCDYANEKINTNKRVESALIRKYYDIQVTHFIKNNENPIVIILGCGLDTRYSRIDESTSHSVFYEIDTPEVISIRETVIPSTANDRNVQEYLLSEKWIKSIIKKHKNGQFMIILENLLIHFEKNDIENLFKNISKHFSNCEIHFDTETKYVYSKPKSILKKIKTHCSPIITLPDNFKYKSSNLLTEISEWKQIQLKKNPLSKLIDSFNSPKHKFSHYSLK